MTPPARDTEVGGPRFANFEFRGIHPHLLFGTASDRYGGWLGQIYTRARYEGRISRRSVKLGSRSFTGEFLPVESVVEYFEHFEVLELDFTFYGLLQNPDGSPSRTFHALSAYARHLPEDARVLLKVPQAVFARRLRRGGKVVENPQYLDPVVFRRWFYEPACKLLSEKIAGFVFEQEYQKSGDRPAPQQVAREFDAFFGSVPGDSRYHVELRTDALLRPPVFDVLEARGVGVVLSHWTWLPPLSVQYERMAGRPFNRGRTCVLRLMTPRGVRYEDAYARTHPFDRIQEDMLDERMLDDTVAIARDALRRDMRVFVIVNNRSGGNAPLIVQRLALRFVSRHTSNSRRGGPGPGNRPG
ncbi:DUF72 domain-containing protein [Desulfoglaeba alkanexedens]|uniref:DUF72 domain-containing protein n=1 Tax=Desulfoglaeba alkanexedens TaxID=361111 RepID=UPI001FE98415|nr:DUF72 domain-containing protein [Desulfoglaeba alkanexedens]